MIHNIFNDLEKKELNEDLEYSEVENNEYIFLVIKNTNISKSYIIELSFDKLKGLKLDFITFNKNKYININEEIYNIIFYPGRLAIISLKKDKLLIDNDYDFLVNYHIMPI